MRSQRMHVETISFPIQEKSHWNLLRFISEQIELEVFTSKWLTTRSEGTLSMKIRLRMSYLKNSSSTSNEIHDQVPYFRTIFKSYDYDTNLFLISDFTKNLQKPYRNYAATCSSSLKCICCHIPQYLRKSEEHNLNKQCQKSRILIKGIITFTVI